jgi:Mn2+/Fe2+ NRAMP family transporter
MNRKGLLKALGPGILFASTAVGVSHLVQSTRAGADYGFSLVWIIIVANLFKYPFFEFGSRYANVQGESIIDGYRRIGKAFLWIYFLITVGSMFFVTAAVGVVTAGFMANLFGVSQLLWVVIGLFAICVSILLLGKYKVLDSLIKIIGSVLLVSTVIAFVLTLVKGPANGADMIPAIELTDATTFAFIIALMGWMPTAVDMSTWNSLWTIERIKQTGYKPTLKETLFDFNFGYLTSAVLSICFVTLGAFAIFGMTGPAEPYGAASYAHKVVGLYTYNLGHWSYALIASCGFAVMFGTCIAVFDGYARALERSSELLFLKPKEAEKELGSPRFYYWSLVILGFGAFGVIYYMLFYSNNPSGFKALVDLATTISFVIAPVIAIVNLRLVTNKRFPTASRPKQWLKLLSYAGILFLIGFGLMFFASRLGWL